MTEQFLYNPKTHTLHIKGYCCHTKWGTKEYLLFRSENEALAYDGRAVGLCKLCQKKREKRIDQ